MNSHEKALVSVVTLACSIEATSSESQNTSIPAVAPVAACHQSLEDLDFGFVHQFLPIRESMPPRKRQEG